MYEFKENIKNTVAQAGSGLLYDQFLLLKETYLKNPVSLRRQIQDVRSVRILTQVVWITICTYLQLKSQISDLDEYKQPQFIKVANRSISRTNPSRSRSPIYNRSPMALSLTSSVLSKKRKENIYVNFQGMKAN